MHFVCTLTFATHSLIRIHLLLYSSLTSKRSKARLKFHHTFAPIFQLKTVKRIQIIYIKLALNLAIIELEETIHTPSDYADDHFKTPLWSNMNEIFYPQEDWKVGGKINFQTSF